MARQTINGLRGGLYALLTASVIFAAVTGVIALAMERNGPVDGVIVAVWIDTATDILMLPPVALLVGIAVAFTFFCGAVGKETNGGCES
jgi:hypothetical protein